MERRTDYRHGLQYELTLTDRDERTVLGALTTTNVSATGLRFTSPEPHGLAVGARFEVRMLTKATGRADADAMVLSTEATLIRTSESAGSMVFDRPLAY